MKRLLMLIAATAGIGLAAFAGDYTWTGAVNNNWTNTGNWTPTGCPNTSADYARFKSPVTVLVDTSGTLNVGCIILSDNASLVTLNGVEGAVLDLPKAASANSSSFLVLAGCKLVVNLPVSTTMRIDKWHGGEVEFATNVTTTATANPFVLDNGKVTLSGTTTFSAANGDVSIGNYTNGDTATLELKDSASLTAANILTGINPASNAAVGHIIQNGDGTSVNVAGGLALSTKAGHEKPSVYELNAGTLNVGGTLTIGSKEPAQYVQTGGTSTVAAVTIDNSSSVSLRGGVMNCAAAPTIKGGSTFELDGGTLALSAGAHKWNGLLANYQVNAGSTLGISGTASLALENECSTYDIGLEIGAGTTVTVASGARVSAPVGSTTPWKVTINDGATFKLEEATARLAVPLDLAVNGSGKVEMYSSSGSMGYGFRGVAIAHSLSVDGVPQAKGRYNGSVSYLSAGTAESVNSASTIIVPYVWTGTGADDNWNTAANWEGGSVPPSDSPVDISCAATITLNSDVTVSCLIAMPNTISRKTTVTGTGSISMGHSIAYSCGIYVPVGCELVLDVDFKRSSNNVMSMMGGGKLTVTKTLPSSQTGSYPLLAVDGTISLAGVKSLVPYTGSSYNFFNHYSANLNTKGEFLIEDGTEIASLRLSEGYPGFLHDVYVRQVGGVTTWTNCWIQSVNVFNPDGAVCYYLDGGEMNAPNGVLVGNTSQVSTSDSGSKSRPGGSFEMSGGTLRCGGIVGGCNQNYVRLYGGDIYLSGNCSLSRIPDNMINRRVENAVTFYLGGVTFHPVGTYRTFADGSTIYLTGKNGDPVFDVTDYNLAIMGGTVEGPGGFVVSGPNGRTFTARGTYTNTGTIRVTGGANLDIQTATLNGPTKIVVEHTSSLVNIYGTTGNSSNPCTVLKDPEVIVLAATSCLTLGTGQALNVKRLVVNGADYAAGTYTFGSGTVTVGAAPASWEVNGVGDLSWYADGTTTTVDAATTLSSLTYDPATAGQTNTLSGAALTFEDGANIHVEKGATLVINNDVVFDGKVTKTGWGEVVFNGAVSGVATPTASSDSEDPCWLTVREGGATFDSTVQGVRLMTCGSVDADDPPVITLKENCTVSNYAIVLTAWNVTDGPCRGETHQEGATVDYSTGIYTNLISGNSNWCLTNPHPGGYGRYVLDSGTLRSLDNRHLSFVYDSAQLGSFEFVQNGGTFILPKDFMFARRNDGVKFTYTLNGGRFEFGGYLSAAYAPSCSIMNLNGGTYVANASDTIMRESITLNMSGTNTFDVASGKVLNIANDATVASSIIKTGAGTLALDGVINLDALDVQAGTVTLTDTILPALDGTADLSIANNATLNLANNGTATFKTLHVGSLERGAGVYSASQGPKAVKDCLSGSGALRILKGSDPGMTIIIR